jgi:hypothetical protein
VTHTREYVWFPGGNPTEDSDILVVYDRTAAPTKAQWLYHVPWKPTVEEGTTKSEDLTLGSGLTGRIGTAYEGAGLVVKELNSVGDERDDKGGTADYTGGAGAHGVLLAKTLLPAVSRVEVSRVAEFDDNVVNRQGTLAIKAHRWQVAVMPLTWSGSQRFLHVFQAGDATRVGAMVATGLVNATGLFEGAWVERERAGRPHAAVLFHTAEGPYAGTLEYTITGTGSVRHVVCGLLVPQTYTIQDLTTGQMWQAAVEPIAASWDYKGVMSNVATGVLSFVREATGTHRLRVAPGGGGGGGPVGDLNGSGAVTIADLRLLIQMLTGATAASAVAKALAAPADALTLADVRALIQLLVIE